MLLPEKVARFHRTISRLSERYRRPALLVSFGKDSHTLLHLLLPTGWPVVILRPAHVGARQWSFAARMVAHYALRPHFVPPEAVALRVRGDDLHVVTSYRVGEGDGVLWEQAIVPTPTPDLCAVDDIFDQPVGRLHTKWDLLLNAQKDQDPDLAGGRLERPLDVLHNPGGPDLAFPLRTWTDADIWEYHHEHGLPIDHDRYTGAGETADVDLTRSNDHLHACAACLDRRNGPTVHCPRLGGEISNRSATTPYV